MSGDSGVSVVGGSYNAVVSGTATLLQAIEFSGDPDSFPSTAHCTSPAHWRVPVMTVTDAPAFGRVNHKV